MLKAPLKLPLVLVKLIGIDTAEVVVGGAALAGAAVNAMATAKTSARIGKRNTFIEGRHLLKNRPTSQ
jgi:hypothetical protein